MKEVKVFTGYCECGSKLYRKEWRHSLLEDVPLWAIVWYGIPAFFKALKKAFAEANK